VLVVAEKRTFGACLMRILQAHGCLVTIMESCGRETVHAGRRAVSKDFDLVILTNTCLTPAHIRTCVLDVKTRYPHARTLVLSGDLPKDFVADLREKGLDGFLPLPYEEESLLLEIAWLLSTQTALA
jgi:hypothetical protein